MTKYPPRSFQSFPAKPGFTLMELLSYHDGAGEMGFADRHSKTKKWRDNKVLSYGNANDPTGNFIAQDTTSGDLQWLQARTT